MPEHDLGISGTDSNNTHHHTTDAAADHAKLASADNSKSESRQSTETFEGGSEHGTPRRRKHSLLGSLAWIVSPVVAGVAAAVTTYSLSHRGDFHPGAAGVHLTVNILLPREPEPAIQPNLLTFDRDSNGTSSADYPSIDFRGTFKYWRALLAYSLANDALQQCLISEAFGNLSVNNDTAQQLYESVSKDQACPVALRARADFHLGVIFYRRGLRQNDITLIKRANQAFENSIVASGGTVENKLIRDLASIYQAALVQRFPDARLDSNDRAKAAGRSKDVAAHHMGVSEADRLLYKTAILLVQSLSEPDRRREPPKKTYMGRRNKKHIRYPHGPETAQPVIAPLSEWPCSSARTVGGKLIRAKTCS
jgi:hypothetical protein